MNKYKIYKNSMIDWIGTIPAHWKTVQPKYKLKKVTRPVCKNDEIITCFRDGIVTLRKNKRLEGFTVSLQEIGYQQVRPNDLVVHQMDGHAGAIGISDSRGKSSPVYTVIEPDGRCDLRYVKYVLNEMAVSEKITSLAKSVRERTTEFRWDIWSTTKFPFPPIKEQTYIAAFIEKKCREIQLNKEKTQRKIELLKEQRKSLINRCVTKGLDANVELKDSGVEWIGRIPQHWSVVKLKYLVSHNDDLLPNNTNPNFMFHYLQLGDIELLKEINLTEKISFAESPSRARRIVRYTDVAVPTVGTEQRSVAFIPDAQDIICSTGFCVLRGKEEKVNQRFLFYSVQSEHFIEEVLLNSYGVIYPAINPNALVGIKIAVPPKDEQLKIAEYLDTKISKFGDLIAFEMKRVDLLNEYRQSLISAAVTGKIKITEDML